MSSGSIVFIVLVLAVTVMGFLAAGWGKANLSQFDEWALGGRRFGTLVSWFLLGSDLYTAYTFVAVPALIYGVGALGFFAVPYATIAYPIVFLILARFWLIAKHRGYITTADFVRDRYGDRRLEIAIAITGVLAAMPYIALQLVGMQTIFGQLGGFFTAGDGHIALVVAFIILASYTFTSGLRAPAMIAFVKDTLIYVTVIAAIIIIPAKLGGWAHIFNTASTALSHRPKPGHILLTPPLYFGYATWALGSAFSLFIYPHSITSLLAAKSKFVIQRNAVLLPAYSLLLGFLGLLGYCAIAAGIVTKNANTAIPMLFARFFPDWFAGFANAAIVIGALVPAAIMAIGAANLFASNIFAEFHTNRPPGETRVAKWICLAMCACALAIVFTIPVQYAIYFQLLGGAWMLQIAPALMFGLYTRWFHPKALFAGWLCGMIAATWMGIATGFTPMFALHLGSLTLNGFIGIFAVVINIAVAVVLTKIYRDVALRRGIGSVASDECDRVLATI